MTDDYAPRWHDALAAVLYIVAVIVVFLGIVGLVLGSPVSSTPFSDHIQTVLCVTDFPNGGIDPYTEVFFRELGTGYLMIATVGDGPGARVTRLQDHVGQHGCNVTVIDGTVYEAELRQAIAEWEQVPVKHGTWGKIKAVWPKEGE